MQLPKGLGTGPVSGLRLCYAITCLCGHPRQMPPVNIPSANFGLLACWKPCSKQEKHPGCHFVHTSSAIQSLYDNNGCWRNSVQVRDTVDIDGCRVSYYTNLFPLNPGGIIPSGPKAADLQLDLPANRGSSRLEDVCYTRASTAAAAAAVATM